jgi:large subunit ribosomal protein L3
MKVGMMAIWDAWGERHAVTVLQVDNCRVVEKKTPEKFGYTALQLTVGEAKLKRVPTGLLKHYNRAKVAPGRKLMEFRVTPDALIEPGTRIPATHFVAGQVINSMIYIRNGLASCLVIYLFIIVVG